MNKFDFTGRKHWEVSVIS